MRKACREIRDRLTAADFLGLPRLLVVEALEEVVRHPTAFRAVWHPVGGFMCLTLASDQSSILRLHAWTPLVGAFDRASWPVIHDHSWVLNSYVVCGKIKNTLYDVSPAEELATHRIYTVRYEGEDINHLLATANLVSCRVRSCETISTEHLYRVEVGAFHSTDVAPGEVVCTVVLAVASSQRAPRVLGEVNGEAAYSMRRHSCLAHEVRNAVSMVVERLGSE